MALEINGTTGISGVDGSASAPVLAGTDSNTGLSFGTDIVNINTGGITRATIDSNGQLNLTNDIKYSNDNPFVYSYNGGSDGQVRSGIQFDGTNQLIAFYTGTNERARFISDGKFIVGATSTFDTVSAARVQISAGGAAGLAITGNSTGGQSRLSFFNPNGRVGFINTSGSSTGYNTSSDYRLKENAVAISDGITRLKTLKPYRFNWKTDASTTVDGFFAHEVTAVPEAVTGEKDEVDSANNPVYQAIDQSKLVPLLTAALQEAVGKIETLETKVAALEAA
tara:strand:+ start:2851 stop:3693 length:843 start_codon:yes stop_codon:yes gene_type:complete